ncbi:MAG: hypothetical protein JWR16_2553 [Nevskia sp.]|nr:hypothetical protein [Nevskia sp.]
MSVPAFSIVGRGKAGRALAQAWGSRIALLSHDETPVTEWVLLAVPDAAIAAQAARFPGHCVHLSGSLDLDDVPCAHPLTSFGAQADDWRGTPLALTGAVPQFITDAFVELGFVPFVLPREHKALYHAVAVLACAHSATLWLGAQALLAEAGVTLPGAGLRPLVEITVRKIFEQGASARTGPFVRGDQATIQRDAAALPPAWREVFLKLGVL